MDLSTLAIVGALGFAAYSERGRLATLWSRLRPSAPADGRPTIHEAVDAALTLERFHQDRCYAGAKAAREAARCLFYEGGRHKEATP